MAEPVRFFRGMRAPEPPAQAPLALAPPAQAPLAQAPSPVVAMQEKREDLCKDFYRINNAICQYLTTQGDNTTAVAELHSKRSRVEDAIKTLTEAIAVMQSDK